MERETTLGRIEFDSETYEVAGGTHSADATTAPAPVVGALQLGLLGAVAARDRRAALNVPRGEFPDDLVGLRSPGPIAGLARQRLH